MLFSPATENGRKVLKKCVKFFASHPLSLIFPILIIVNTSAIFLSVLAAEEHYYGISLFKPETFYNWLSIDISHHLFKAFFLLFILFITSFINNIFNTALTFYFLKKLNKQKHSLLLALKWSFLKIPLISYIATILLIDLVYNFLNNLLSPYIFFEELLAVLQGKKLNPKNMLHAEEGMIFLPLIVSNDKSIPENIVQSDSLMKKSFGENFIWNVSFLEIKFFTILIVVSTFGFFTHYHYNLLPAFIFSFFLIFIVFLLIDTTILFFKACLFNYIAKKPTGNFTRKEINSYFIKEEQ